MSRRLLLVLLGIGVCVVCTRPLQAQTADNSRADYKRQFYVFVSGGVVSGVKLDLDPAIPVPSFNSWQIGGAAEWFQFKGLAIGGELAEAPRVTRAKPITYTYQTRSGAEATNTIAAGGLRSSARSTSPTILRDCRRVSPSFRLRLPEYQ